MDVDEYCSSQSTGKEVQEDRNSNHMEEFSYQDAEKEEGQYESSAEEEKESETEEETQVHFNVKERETRSVVVHMQTGYAFLDERWKRIDEVTRGVGKCARPEAEVPEFSTSASNQETQTIS